MQDELSYLIKLQELDSQTDEVRERAAAFLPRIQEKTRKIEGLKDGMKHAKEQLSGHQLKKKQLELDADAKEKLVQKHQGELNGLKSNDAYKAMLSEIQAAKDAVKKIEDEILVVMEAIEADDRAFKENEKKFKESEGAVKREIQELESQKAALETEAKAKQADRDAFAATVPAPLLARYDTIREKGGGVAIVPLVNGSCGGCRMSITPNKANEVKKAKNMVLCDSCTRILYLPPAEPTVTASTDRPADSSPTVPTA